MSGSATAGWVICALFALAIGAAVRWGAIPGTEFQTIWRSEQPRLFWFCIGVACMVLLILIGLALAATFFPQLGGG